MIQAALLFAQGAFGVGSAMQTMSAGDSQARALKLEAKQEEVNATIRNNERLERLVNAMAINNASLASRGITVEGSPTEILKSNWINYGEDAQKDLMQSEAMRLSLKARANSVMALSRIQAASSLLGTAVDIGKTGGTGTEDFLSGLGKKVRTRSASKKLDTLMDNSELF